MPFRPNLLTFCCQELIALSRTCAETYPGSSVAKRSYSRAIFHSFPLTQSHSFSGHKSLTFYHNTCGTRVGVKGAELTSNQIRPSALMQVFRGRGFGCGSVAVLVTIRDMSRSQMVRVAGKKYCMTSVGSYQLVSLDHLQ